MAIVVAVAALFSERTFELWGRCCGTTGVVEFLNLDTSTFFEGAIKIQKAEIVVLQIYSSDVVR